MSIQRRLAVSIVAVLLVSLLLGGILTYGHVIAKIDTEMRASLAVGMHSAQNAVDDEEEAVSPLRRLHLVVGDFDGDRHIQAILKAPDGRDMVHSRLLPPDDPAPAWFYRLVVEHRPIEKTLELPAAFRSVGTVTLHTDPHNEVAEAWSDVRLTLIILSLFFAMVLALAFLTIKAALKPLGDVCKALLRIGSGDYSARIAPRVAYELAPLRDGFNVMAARLEEMVEQNHSLHQQIIKMQEEERSEIACDLHDEIAPFVFAVGADAAMIEDYLTLGATDEVAQRAKAIGEAVKHMHAHLRDVLGRLAPGALLDLGLAGAIENLVSFWKVRCPSIRFGVEVTGEPLDPPYDAIAFRVVQESFSNAVRHGRPTTIDAIIDVDETKATIVIEDDGIGLPGGKLPYGFGLTGMRERVRSVEGTISVRNRKKRRGVNVEATLPLRSQDDHEADRKMEVAL